MKTEPSTIIQKMMQGAQPEVFHNFSYLKSQIFTLNSDFIFEF